MKKFLASLFLVLVSRLLAVAPVPLTEGVSFSFRISGVGNGIMSVYDEAGTPSLGQTTNNATTESAIATAWLRPGKQYAVNFQASGPYEFWLSYIAPAGYVLLVNDQPTTISYASPGGGWYSYNYTVELRPLANYEPAPIGSFSGIDVGKSLTWEVGTGMLRNGRSAGRFVFKELDLSNSPASRSRLYYSVAGNYGEITVIKDGASNQTLRQIATPQGFMDLVDDAGGGYWINCYQNSQVQTAPPGQTWVIIPGQTPWKTIRVESPSASQLKITETEGAVAHVSLLSLTSGTVASGNYGWTLQEGDGTNWLRTTQHTSTSGSSTSGPTSTGGTVTTSGGYRIHTFTGSGTFSLSAPVTADLLVVGGGGGGSSGGGGGGGVNYLAGYALAAGSYAVTVGAGGAGNGGFTATANSGGFSAFNGNYGYGGGGGGDCFGNTGLSGGSGGGAGRYWNPGTLAGGAGTVGQGFNGGASPGNSSSLAPAGGGGGAGGAGFDGIAATNTSGAGGSGVANSISGASVTYGGGGGGGSTNAVTAGAGGTGGGGAGSSTSYANGTSGTNGLGGGGGGCFDSNGVGGSGGSGVVIIRYVASGTTTYFRDDAVTVRTGDVTGPVVAKTNYHYVTLPWGEEVTQVTADPGGAALTTTYDYYTDPAAPGNYRKVKSVTAPTGAWSASQYYDDWNRRGQLQYQFQPYLDAPATVTLDPAQGRVVSLDYMADWTGRFTRPTVRQEKINNVLTGQTTWTHGDNVGVGWPREYSFANAYRDGTNYQVSYEEHYRGDAGLEQPFRPYTNYSADRVRTTTSETSGSYNAGTQTFTADGSNGGWRQLVLHGSDLSLGADSVSSWGGQSFAATYLVPNKSTMDAVIRDVAGNPIRTETYVYTGAGSFSLVTSENLAYDAAGRLTSRVSGNGSGATTTNAYANGYLTSTVGIDGTETQFTYDLLGRVATSIKKGAAASGTFTAQSDITTTYTYDGVGHASQTVSTGGSLSQTATSAYDLAGRLIQTVAPGGYTTAMAYAAGGRIVTATLPGGATKTTETYLDGQLKSVSGPAVVAENYSYAIDGSTGQRLRQSFYGGNYSAFTNTYTDWLCRQVAEWKPRWDGNNWATFWTYNSSGQLVKVSQPGLADTLYEYDTLGQVVREGRDVNANGTLDLASDDRITDHAYSLFIDGLGRATSSQQSKVYASSGSGTATTTSTHSVILSGLSAGQIANTTDLDIFGNATYSSTTVDRANKTVTTTVTVPTSSTPVQQIAYNGLLMSARDQTNITMTYGYDALGRRVTSVDPRTGPTTTAYVAGTSQVLSVTDPAGFVQATYAYDSAGRTAAVTNALGKVCRYDYTARGEKLHVWGDTDYPVEYGYDSQGRQTTLKTYRTGTGFTGPTWPAATAGTADTTTWNFHAATGLLSSKVDATGKSVAYTYTVAGQIATRAWARTLPNSTIPVTTTYAYSPTTGELTGVSYNDGTPAVTYTYNRLGQQATVADTTGTRTFAYNLAGSLELQYESLPTAFYGDRRINRGYDTAAGTVGRYNRLSVGNAAGTLEYDVSYGYDPLGRLNKSYVFDYTYLANSNLLQSVAYSGWNYTDTRNYDPTHDWVASRTTVVGTTKASFGYTRDSLGRVTQTGKTGELFNRYGDGTQGLWTNYGYDDRSQLTSEQTRLAGTTTVLTGRDDAYAFDNLGNRSTATHNGNSTAYTSNSLNQYSSRTVPGVFDVAGAAASAATVTVNGSAAGVARHGDYFFKGQPLTNTSSAVYSSLSISDGTTTTALQAFLPASPEPFAYDADGNLLADGRWTYTYDAENRLTAMETTGAAASAGTPRQRLEFRYDGFGRRIGKKVFHDAAGWVLDFERRFVYDGWNMIEELNGTTGAKLRTYAWGLDLVGSLQGAGGVGGLLLTRDGSDSYLPVYDGNGNVHGLVKAADGSLAAAYEYDAFGRTLRESGPYAATHALRFATKYTDLETGLLYYGLRYYSPGLGRFINRDPFSERGGLNLYEFVQNNAVSRWDYLGLDAPEHSFFTTVYVPSTGHVRAGIVVVGATPVSHAHGWLDDSQLAPGGPIGFVGGSSGLGGVSGSNGRRGARRLPPPPTPSEEPNKNPKQEPAPNKPPCAQLQALRAKINAQLGAGNQAITRATGNTISTINGTAEGSTLDALGSLSNNQKMVEIVAPLVETIATEGNVEFAALGSLGKSGVGHVFTGFGIISSAVSFSSGYDAYNRGQYVDAAVNFGNGTLGTGLMLGSHMAEQGVFRAGTAAGIRLAGATAAIGQAAIFAGQEWYSFSAYYGDLRNQGATLDQLQDRQSQKLQELRTVHEQLKANNCQ
ncbi:MAG: RHS repeat-associated core domain-containing protein [Opitutae bacterium]|nr:RHS repeat-associated core domain-containing protein [Opitutae bacterium]